MKFYLLLLFAVIACAPEIDQKSEMTIEPVAKGKSFRAGFLLIDGVYNSVLMAPYDIFQNTSKHFLFVLNHIALNYNVFKGK